LPYRTGMFKQACLEKAVCVVCPKCASAADITAASLYIVCEEQVQQCQARYLVCVCDEQVHHCSYTVLFRLVSTELLEGDLYTCAQYQETLN